MTQRTTDTPKSLTRNCTVSLIATIPLVIISLMTIPGAPLATWLSNPKQALSLSLFQVVLIIPVVLSGKGYFYHGFTALLRGAPDKNSLVASGAGASIAYSLYAIVGIFYCDQSPHSELCIYYASSLYFAPAALLLTLMNIESVIEDRAKGTISGVIEKMNRIRPETVLTIQDGLERMIPTGELHVGDHLILKPGQIIPVDGVVTAGKTLVDNSAMTGSSMPVEKTIGDLVWGATVNLSGFLSVQVEKTVSDSLFSRLIQLIEQAFKSKKPIPQTIDRIGRIFIPVIFLSVLFTALIWFLNGATHEFIFSSAIAVLIIASPSALGLAIPTAILIGTRVGARRGLLIKSARALQLAKKVDTVIIEKAGIITAGRPGITDVLSFSDLDHNELLAIAIAIEKRSEHPLAAAFAAEAEKSGLIVPPVDNFQGFPGQGVAATLKGHRYFGGSPDFLRANGIPVDALENDITRLAGSGKVPFCFGGDGQPLGIVAVADILKPGALEAITALKKLQVEVIVWTGENARTAEGIRRMTGISRIMTELLPDAKAAFIQKLRAEGRTVAMIGDGIHDIPTLIAADVGMALGRGTEITREAADIILLQNDLRDSITVLRLGRKVVRNINENLIWALIFNTLGIPLAAGMFYTSAGLKLTPRIAAAVMVASSLAMILNALRLNFFRKGVIND